MRVLMCTDGSKFSEEAIEIAGYLLKGVKPRATVLRVIPDIVKEYKEYNEFAKVFKEEIHKMKKLGIPETVAISLEKGRKILKKFGIESEVKTRKGKASDEILNEAERGRYSMIVAASYGSGISKFMLGSVSREVVHRAKIPVLVVKGKESISMM